MRHATSLTSSRYSAAKKSPLSFLLAWDETFSDLFGSAASSAPSSSPLLSVQTNTSPSTALTSMLGLPSTDCQSEKPAEIEDLKHLENLENQPKSEEADQKTIIISDSFDDIVIGDIDDFVFRQLGFEEKNEGDDNQQDIVEENTFISVDSNVPMTIERMNNETLGKFEDILCEVPLEQLTLEDVDQIFAELEPEPFSSVPQQYPTAFSYTCSCQNDNDDDNDNEPTTLMNNETCALTSSFSSSTRTAYPSSRFCLGSDITDFLSLGSQGNLVPVSSGPFFSAPRSPFSEDSFTDESVFEVPSMRSDSSQKPSKKRGGRVTKAPYPDVGIRLQTKLAEPTIWNDEVLDLPLREFNAYLRTTPLTPDQVADLKAARRRRKNKLYARFARMKKFVSDCPLDFEMDASF